METWTWTVAARYPRSELYHISSTVFDYSRPWWCLWIFFFIFPKKTGRFLSVSAAISVVMNTV